jgi:hypothetical protein
MAHVSRARSDGEATKVVVSTRSEGETWVLEPRVRREHAKPA